MAHKTRSEQKAQGKPKPDKTWYRSRTKVRKYIKRLNKNWRFEHEDS